MRHTAKVKEPVIRMMRQGAPGKTAVTAGRHWKRDRADAENCFDELKNLWGWGGFTSRKLAPSRLIANLIALFYN